MAILQLWMPMIRRQHLPAWGVSLLAHLGLIWAFSSEGGAFDSVGDRNAALQISIVMLNGIPAAELETVRHGEKEVKVASAVAHLRSPEQRTVIPAPSSSRIAPHYFSVKELTRKPLIMQDIPKDLTLNVPIVSPQAAILRILINEYGSVDRIVVEDSVLPDMEQEMVIESFSKMRFHPGEINGVPVRSQLKIEVMLNALKA